MAKSGAIEKTLVDNLQSVLDNLKSTDSGVKVVTTKKKVDALKKEKNLDLLDFSDKITTKALTQSSENVENTVDVLTAGISELLSGRDDIIEICDFLFDTNYKKDLEDMSAIKAKKEIDRITMEFVGQLYIMLRETIEYKLEAIIENAKKTLG